MVAQSTMSVSLLNTAYQRNFQTAVSLHAHTHYSKEGLGFVPRYVARIPIICSFFNHETNRYFRLKGKRLDFGRGYWTPPVKARAVVRSEMDTIERRLGLKPLVSITDHDNIATGKPFRQLSYLRDLPVSLEWTLPFEDCVFHLGIHNLPVGSASQITAELQSYRFQPRSGRLKELFEWLNEFPETLIVLNHPFSDLESLGMERLKPLLFKFLREYGTRIHALEVNGYRPWSENQAVIALADQFDLPVVSGGDRHAFSPNALLNLTNAATFSEFASEIRCDRHSQVLVMPEYCQDLFARKMDSVADFLRFYPDYPHGEQCWTDRIFFQLEDGVVRPLSYYWHRTVPIWVKSVMWVFSLISNKYLRPALHSAFTKGWTHTEPEVF